MSTIYVIENVEEGTYEGDGNYDRNATVRYVTDAQIPEAQIAEMLNPDAAKRRDWVTVMEERVDVTRHFSGGGTERHTIQAFIMDATKIEDADYTTMLPLPTPTVYVSRHRREGEWADWNMNISASTHRSKVENDLYGEILDHAAEIAGFGK
jgi:hypothetical protein